MARPRASWVSEKALKELGLKPMAKLRGYSVGSGDPGYLGPAQIPAIKDALAQAGITIADLGLIECNEAFASPDDSCRQGIRPG